MDNVAEFWVAAHFAYSESNAPTVVSEQQWIWIQKLQKIVADYTDTSEKEKFKSQLNIEVLDKTIFVYTPRWDIKELPSWSTVLDFAFSVHSSIGLRFKNAIVNWQIKPISYKLKTWDIVNINTFKNRYAANKHWLEFLRTPSAKNQLLKYLKTAEREARLEEAIDNLNEYLKDLWLPTFRSDKDKIQKLWEPLDVERRILMVLDKQDTYGNIVRDAYPDLLKNVVEKTVLEDSDELEQGLREEIEAPVSTSVVVDDDKHLNCIFCPECQPKPWDKIIAKSSKTWIKIHNMTCKALKTVSFESLLEAHWMDEPSNQYRFDLKLKFRPHELTIVDFLQVFSQFNVPLLEMSIKHNDDWLVFVDFSLQIDNPAKISFVLKDLKKFSVSLEVLRKTIS